jgi:hypothetical protein
VSSRRNSTTRCGASPSRACELLELVTTTLDMSRLESGACAAGAA